jgi:hypothetical protein
MMFMSQRSSKHPADGAPRGRPRTLGREVQAKPVVDIRGQSPWGKIRPFAQRQADDTQSAACLQGYLQWAGFVAGTKDGDFGFGTYFVDDRPSAANGAQSSAGMMAYTWTPAGRG